MLLFMPLVFIRGTKFSKREVLLSFVYGVYERNVQSQIRCLKLVLLLPYHNKAKHTSDSFFFIFARQQSNPAKVCKVCLLSLRRRNHLWHCCALAYQQKNRLHDIFA